MYLLNNPNNVYICPRHTTSLVVIESIKCLLHDDDDTLTDLVLIHDGDLFYSKLPCVVPIGCAREFISTAYCASTTNPTVLPPCNMLVSTREYLA